MISNASLITTPNSFDHSLPAQLLSADATSTTNIFSLSELNTNGTNRSIYQGGVRAPQALVKLRGDNYIVGMLLPGVLKDSLDLRIEHNGRSLTIRGKVMEDFPGPLPSVAFGSRFFSTAYPDTMRPDGEVTALAGPALSGQTTHTNLTRNGLANTTFVRTIWLARPLDINRINVGFVHGVLLLNLPHVKVPSCKLTLA